LDYRSAESWSSFRVLALLGWGHYHIFRGRKQRKNCPGDTFFLDYPVDVGVWPAFGNHAKHKEFPSRSS
jgi:hypothetical protein